MALTLGEEQKLEAVGLIDHFEKYKDRWKALAQESYAFVSANFPAGSVVRPDDVAKVLFPLLEVRELLTDFLSAKKLPQKYWRLYFCNLIIDRFWPELITKTGP